MTDTTDTSPSAVETMLLDLDQEDQHVTSSPHDSYEIIKALAAERDALTAQIAAADDKAFNAGLESASVKLEHRAEQIIKEHGNYEYDTGVTNLPEFAETQLEELEGAIEDIRALRKETPTGETRD